MSRGRPRFDIDRNNVIYLRSLHFKWTQISQILGVSERTLRRRAREWNLLTYSIITDIELDTIVMRHLEDFPCAGEAMLRGCLTSHNVIVPRERLRQSVRRVRGFDTQTPPTIFRRTYVVPGPNYLWHIDGHHKLIKWRLVTHGGIDGFSRLITYLKCSNNNRSETVTTCFIEAAQQYGIPSRVRSDHGTENVGVWLYMEELRGRDRHSYIAGRSVHNCRIERLWKDVYNAVTTNYVAVFTQLEQEGILDPENETDLFCLHYIFIPRINKSLEQFTEAWNNHPLSSEHNRSPLQLYVGGSIGNPLFDEDIADLQMYGVDDSISVDEDVDESITIPSIDIGLSVTDLLFLHTNIDPLDQCNDFGMQLYRDTAQLVFHLMQQYAV